MSGRLKAALIGAAFAGSLLPAAPSAGQETPAAPPLPLVQLEGQAAPPVLLTLQDALQRAQAVDAQFQASTSDAQIAHEDRVQAKAGLMPAFSFTTQYLGNSPNGVNPNGRYVSLDGVNMYRVWGVVHQEISPNLFMATPVHRATAAEAQAEARLEIARRGLRVTVTKNYYALVTAQRKYATAQEAAQQAQRFLAYAQQQERLGQVAHSDAVKAEIQSRLQQQAFQDAALAMENARLGLAVLTFPVLTENFTVVDDLASGPVLPPFADVRAMAERMNPELRAANEALRVAQEDVTLARNALLPTLVFDGIYGIEANEFALHSAIAAQPELGILPNLGYFVTVNLQVPVWDWGNLRSKLTQNQLRERRAAVELTQAQRQAVSDLHSMYNEALAARAAVDNLRATADLAAESLRLTALRYQAGESTALEVVDAQNTSVQARSAFDDGQSRYRVALAQLQTLTGEF